MAETGEATDGRSRGGRRPPRYREILETLSTRIAGGDYPVGGALPSESELCREFSASRFTVREALRRLQADGLVARQQGAGTRVIRATPAAAFVQTVGSVDELLQFARDTGYAVLSTETVAPDPATAARVGAAPGERWGRLRGLRLDGPGGRAMALIDSWIPPRFAHLAPRLPAEKPPFYRLLERESGESVAEVVQEVQAMEMPSDVAGPLGASPGAASLRILRRWQSARGVLIASFNWHLGGDAFVYRSRLEHSGRPGGS